jgi:hypothetical protein
MRTLEARIGFALCGKVDEWLVDRLGRQRQAPQRANRLLRRGIRERHTAMRVDEGGCGGSGRPRMPFPHRTGPWRAGTVPTRTERASPAEERVRGGHRPLGLGLEERPQRASTRDCAAPRSDSRRSVRTTARRARSLAFDGFGAWRVLRVRRGRGLCPDAPRQCHC